MRKQIILSCLVVPLFFQVNCKRAEQVGNTRKSEAHAVELFDAIEKGDLNKARSLLQSDPSLVGAKTTDKTYQSCSPLHIAIMKGQKDMVELLLNNGADIQAKCFNDITPLHVAADKGTRELAGLLISQGANVNATTRDLATPLHWAETRDVAELLITKGADLNAVAANLNTPLHAAVFRDNKEVAEVLVTRGADVNCPNGGNRSALQLVKSEEMGKFLKGFAGKETGRYSCLSQISQIISYATDGDVIWIERLLDNNPYLVNARGSQGNTPLHHAAMAGHKKAVEVLIKRGADINAKNPAGKTAKDLAKTKEIADTLEASMSNNP
jgi:Ankyrin repeats (many copies)/Ankyrin repeats (3 copies)/Ankyrin repeat